MSIYVKQAEGTLPIIDPFRHETLSNYTSIPKVTSTLAANSWVNITSSPLSLSLLPGLYLFMIDIRYKLVTTSSAPMNYIATGRIQIPNDNPIHNMWTRCTQTPLPHDWEPCDMYMQFIVPIGSSDNSTGGSTPVNISWQPQMYSNAQLSIHEVLYCAALINNRYTYRSYT